MKRLTAEWIRKAEADFRTAERESRARRGPNHDAVCFHIQQYVEKYLKARLQEADIRFGRTHDLASLLDQCGKVEPFWAVMKPELFRLSAYAVNVRYPGESADKSEATEAMRIGRRLRPHLRAAFGLSESAAAKRGERVALSKGRHAQPK